MTLLPIDKNMNAKDYVCATPNKGLADMICAELNKVGSGNENYPFCKTVAFKLEGSNERNMFALKLRIVFSTKADIRKVECQKLIQRWEKSSQKFKKYEWSDELIPV